MEDSININDNKTNQCRNDEKEMEEMEDNFNVDENEIDEKETS